MKRFLFTVARHEDFGELGLRPRWYQNGDPLGGMAAAHDILEHFPGDAGDITGELLAFGAAMYIRGDGGYFNNGGEERHLSAEIGDIWQRFNDRREAFPDCKPSRSVELRERAALIIHEGMKEMRDRFNADDLPSLELRAQMVRWLCRGYMLARRRYTYPGRVMDACTLAWFFRQIEQECDKALKHAEEGMECAVLVNVRRCDVRVSIDYPEELYQ